MQRIVIILTLLIAILASCGYSNYPRTSGSPYPNTNPDEILIYPKDIDHEYEIIGPIGTETTGDKDAVIEHLKKKASKQGANAVIHVKLNQVNSSSGHIGVSGIAVKLIQNNDVKYSLAKNNKPKN